MLTLAILSEIKMENYVVGLKKIKFSRKNILNLTYYENSNIPPKVILCGAYTVVEILYP